jgi:hypothetical protein
MEHQKETLQTAGKGPLLNETRPKAIDTPTSHEWSAPQGILYQNLFTRQAALQMAYTLPFADTGTIFLQDVNVDSTLAAGMHTTGCRERIQAWSTPDHSSSRRRKTVRRLETIWKRQRSIAIEWYRSLQFIGHPRFNICVISCDPILTVIS